MTMFTEGRLQAYERMMHCGKLCTWSADVLYSCLRYLYSGKAALESDLTACLHRRFLCFDILRCRMVYHYAGRRKREADGLCQSIKYRTMELVSDDRLFSIV